MEKYSFPDAGLSAGAAAFVQTGTAYGMRNGIRASGQVYAEEFSPYTSGGREDAQFFVRRYSGILPEYPESVLRAVSAGTRDLPEHSADGFLRSAYGRAAELCTGTLYPGYAHLFGTPEEAEKAFPGRGYAVRYTLPGTPCLLADRGAGGFWAAVPAGYVPPDTPAAVPAEKKSGFLRRLAAAAASFFC